MTIISPLPFTLSNGTTADASQVQADLNQIRNDVNSAFASTVPPAQGYYGAFVSKDDATQAITTAGANIIFDTTVLDTNTIFNVSHPTRLTVPSGVSKVRIRAQVSATGSTGRTTLVLKQNTDSVYPYQYAEIIPRASGSDFGVAQFNSAAIICSPGDYFELRAIPDSGTITLGGTAGETWMELEVLG